MNVVTGICFMCGNNMLDVRSRFHYAANALSKPVPITGVV